MNIWVATVTVHGFDDDISMLQFFSTKEITEKQAIRLFNDRYAGKARSGIHDKNVVFPLPFAYDSIGLVYEDPEETEPGLLYELGDYRGAYVKINKVELGEDR